MPFIIGQYKECSVEIGVPPWGLVQLPSWSARLAVCALVVIFIASWECIDMWIMEEGMVPITPREGLWREEGQVLSLLRISSL